MPPVQPYDYWIPFFLLSFVAAVTNSSIVVLICRKRHRKKQDKFTAMFSLGAFLMSATYFVSFAKKFASNCSQMMEQTTPRDCLLTNPHLFIYPFADYVIMLTSFLSSVDCFWTVSCQPQRALFNEKNINWIFAFIGVAALGSVISYTVDVLRRTNEKIQICCLNNLMTTENFIFCYYIVTVSIGSTGAILLVFSAIVYVIRHRSKHAQIRRMQTRRYRMIFVQAAMLVVLSFCSQTLQAIGGLTLLNNRTGDWFFQSIWLITIVSYVFFAIYKAVRDDLLQKKVRFILSGWRNKFQVQERTDVVGAQNARA
uniref:G-protein coupled receptors family 1 profile domain-containing protein n=1 Tax=Trichuris muris TaxID=70415 RepID=A0A5S6PZ60_TRIMR